MGKKRKRTDRSGVTNEDHSYVTDGYHEEQPAVEGAYRYNFYGDMSWDIQKYWKQRFDIFSRYNDGIWMTENSWFEVTPEAIASKIATHISSAIPDGRSIVVDAFCGVGGNTIALALSGKFKRVYAIEKDEAALACAKHNAEIYGVSGKITWFQGDCFEILGAHETRTEKSVNALKQVIGEFGVIFASPPWGGPGYKSAPVFDLSQMQPYSLQDIYSRFGQITKTMALYLPRTSDLKQIAACVGEAQPAQLIHYCTSGTSRALCVYLGDWKRVQ